MPIIRNPLLIESHAMSLFGCSHEEATRLNDGLQLRDRKSKAMAYVNQKHSANQRGIGWEFTFAQWLEMWLSSGKFSLRGKGADRYCMARHGDIGPYSYSNVTIKRNSENSREGICLSWAESKFTQQRSPLGKGRGWTFRSNPKFHKKPYQVVVSKKYIGSFFTSDEAEVAYKAAVSLLK